MDVAREDLERCKKVVSNLFLQIRGFAKGYIDSNLYSKYIDINQSKLVE